MTLPVDPARFRRSRLEAYGLKTQERDISPLWEGLKLKRFEPQEGDRVSLIARMQLAIYKRQHEAITLEGQQWFVRKGDTEAYHAYQRHAERLAALQSELEKPGPKDPAFHEQILLLQKELLAEGHSLRRPLVIESVEHLATLGGEGGYRGTSLEVKRGWRDSALKTSVIFTDESKKLGSGQSGTVYGYEGMIVQEGKGKVNPKPIARKHFKSEAAFNLALRGNKILETRQKLYAEKGQKLVGVAKGYTHFNRAHLTADMKGYVGDLIFWRSKNRGIGVQPVLSAFVPALQAIADFQKDHLVHLDIKSANLVATSDGKEFHHIDTELATPFPHKNDSRPLTEIHNSFMKAFAKGQTVPIFAGTAPLPLLEKLEAEMINFFKHPPKEREAYFKELEKIEKLIDQIQTFEMGVVMFETVSGVRIEEVRQSRDLGTDYILDINRNEIRNIILSKGEGPLVESTANLIASMLKIPPKATIKTAQSALSRILKL